MYVSEILCVKIYFLFFFQINPTSSILSKQNPWEAQKNRFSQGDKLQQQITSKTQQNEQLKRAKQLKDAQISQVRKELNQSKKIVNKLNQKLQLKNHQNNLLFSFIFCVCIRLQRE